MKWSHLRTIVNSKAASITIAIPIVGLFLLFNGKLLDYIDLAKDFVDDVGFNGSGQRARTLNSLYYTYFGLTAFGLGTLIYRIFCPSQIKESANEEAYFEKQMTFPANARAASALAYIFDHYYRKKNGYWAFMPQNRWQIARVEKTFIAEWEWNPVLKELVAKSPSPDTREIGRHWLQQIGGTSVDPSQQAKIRSEHGLEIYTNEYKTADERLVVLRYVAAVLSVGGLICAAVPGMLTFFKIAGRALAILTA